MSVCFKGNEDAFKAAPLLMPKIGSNREVGTFLFLIKDVSVQFVYVTKLEIRGKYFFTNLTQLSKTLPLH